jgi:hypothetical protein
MIWFKIKTNLKSNKFYSNLEQRHTNKYKIKYSNMKCNKQLYKAYIKLVI